MADSNLTGYIHAHLIEHKAAFLFGNTAPDVQTISGQPREATHFFNVPLDSDRPAHRILFDAHPGLGRPERLPPAHAAFMAGYIAHLWLDVMWIRDIFQPIFGPDAGWSTFRDRLFLHNVLRAWCDRRDQARIAPGTGAVLSAAVPDHWLPFTGDAHLRRWRDILVEQFAPGATIRTVQVFAERGRIDPAEFERVLGSEQAMDDLIFSHLSRETIEGFYTRGLTESRALMIEYLEPTVGDPR